MQTVQSFIEQQQQRFRSLCLSRQRSLQRQAAELIDRKPHCADLSNFWRGLSARHVLSVIVR